MPTMMATIGMISIMCTSIRTGEAGALDHANSICAASGLNAFDTVCPRPCLRGSGPDCPIEILQHLRARGGARN